MKRRLLAVFVMVVGIFALAFPALATHPEIDSTATCDGTVTWTATAWVHGDPWRRTTPDDSVEIYRLGPADAATLIAVGEFNAANGFSFSGSLNAPNGQLVRLRVVATEGFFEDEAMTILVAAGSFRETNVRVPDPCPSTTTTSVAPTTTEASTTTVAPTTTAASTTTEPPVTVSGIVVTLPSNPQVSNTTAGTLPFTGMSTGSVAVIGAAVTAMGALLLVASRRGEDKSAVRSWS